MSVTRFGVSLLNVVATMERPASHHGTERPEAKYSDVLRPARFPKNRAGVKQIATAARAMIQSSALSLIGSSSRSNSSPVEPPLCEGEAPPDQASARYAISPRQIVMKTEKSGLRRATSASIPIASDP